MKRGAWSDTLGPGDSGPSTLQGALDTIARAGRKQIPIPFWADIKRLPREARDTLFLVAVIGWTVLPHVQHLPGWASALTAVVLAWRARLAFVNGALPNRWVLAGALAVAMGLTFWSYRTLLGKEPGVAVALMALKTLELRARRDAFVVFFLGFFIILTHFLYSQSLLVALAMLVSVWGLLTAVVLAHMPVGSQRQASGLAARTALLGAPVMAPPSCCSRASVRSGASRRTASRRPACRTSARRRAR